MRTSALQCFLAWSLIAFLCVGSSPLQSADGPANVTVVGERVERVSRDKVHFWLKVVNGSGRTVFLAGINVDRPTPYPVFLEQWRAEEGWKAVAPCVDVPPPHVISLNPSEWPDAAGLAVFETWRRATTATIMSRVYDFGQAGSGVACTTQDVLKSVKGQMD